MKKKHRFLCTLCAAVFFLSTASFNSFAHLEPLSVSAEISIYNDMLLYSVEQDAISITGSFDGNYDEIIIPPEIDGLPVVRIASSAFSNCQYIKTITVPASVKEIESGAFARCEGLLYINVSEDNLVYSSYDGMLYDKYKTCLLRCPNGLQNSELVFPENISAIADTAFQNCYNISEITIPDTVTYIGERAFERCSSLENISLPSSLEEIKAYSFSLCESLAEITLPEHLKRIGNPLSATAHHYWKLIFQQK